MRKQTKIAAIVSAAALLALGASMTSFAATGWQEENGVWVYYNRQGQQVTDTWAKSGETWFYLNDQGEMATDSLIESNDDLFYVDANGAMVTERWVAIDNENAGEDENEPNTLWYYFGANGKAYKGGNGRLSLKTINGKKYTFNQEGKMLYGWVNETGEMINSDDTGEWQNGQYFFGDQNDGAMTVGWKLITIEADDADNAQPGDGFWDNTQDRWFYFKSSGKKQGYHVGTSINGAKYAFDEYGRMEADWNTTATASMANPANQGVASYSNTFRYFSTPEDGARKTKGWFKVVAGYYLNQEDYDNGTESWYYADGNGKIAANKIMVINGKRYAFDAKGKMKSGLVFLDKGGNPNGRDVSVVSNAPETVDALIDWANLNLTDVKSGNLGAYYFGDSADGSMKTGNQTVSFDDQTTRWNFKPASATMGVGTHGLKDNRLYVAGLAVTANTDDKFLAVKYDKTTGSVTLLKSQNEVTALSTSNTTNAKGVTIYSYPVNSGIYVVNTSGTVVKSGAKKDGVGNVYRLKSSQLEAFEVH